MESLLLEFSHCFSGRSEFELFPRNLDIEPSSGVLSCLINDKSSKELNTHWKTFLTVKALLFDTELHNISQDFLASV